MNVTGKHLRQNLLQNTKYLQKVFGKNIKRYTAHTIVSWPNHKQWQKFHRPYFRFDDDNKIKHMYSHNLHKKMVKLKTHSPIYCMKDNWENWLNRRHTYEAEYTWQAFFPMASFGLRVLSLPASVSQSVRHQVCPYDNSSPIQARITKFGP